jgi:hypothetical protein
VRAANENAALDRFNRSYEYDGLGDDYARFLVEELLPDVETKKTADGRPVRFSHDAKDRAIGGSSSGAVCAFTAAWERPDQFSRVWSAIGTYVGLRGADRYPTLLRKYEPKPLRVFLQDGSNDQNIYAGDWWFANQMMERALTFAGYEVEHAWGEGGHSGAHGTALFPDVMRWLWKGWPAPVSAGRSRNTVLSEILLPGENWQQMSPAVKPSSDLVVDAKGEVQMTHTPMAYGPDGRLYAVTVNGKLTAGSGSGAANGAGNGSGKEATLTSGVRGSDLVVAHNGNVYLVEPGSRDQAPSKVWLVKQDGQKKSVDVGPIGARGIALSADQTLLYVSDSRSHWVYSYQIQPDGSLQHKQRYYWLHVPDTAEGSEAAGMCVDRAGRLYVATNLGVQVCDQPGRVNAILPVPGGKVTSVALGGENGDTLYAVAGDKLYRRKLGTRGVHAFEAPTRPGPPRL